MKAWFRYCIGVFLLLLAASSVYAASDPLPRRPVFGAAVADAPAGVRIIAVNAGTPAAAAGLKVGDTITEFAFHKIENSSSFVAEVHAATVLRPIKVTLLRDGATIAVQLQLIPAPKESDPAVDTVYSSINVDGSLRRTLITLPRGASKKLPAVLLIGGIGCFTVDNPSDPYDSYRFLAHDLSHAGIVVMRVEKAGVGDSQGGPCFDTDFNQEFHSYQVALDALASDAHVDPQRIFLFGHSIGTLIAPRLALQAAVAGIVIAEGVGVNWFEYELANLRRQAQLEGDSPIETDTLLRSKEVCMHRLLIDHTTETEIEKDMPECKKRNAYPVAAPYVQQVAALNIAEPWTKVQVPVLAIYGTADFVTTESDHRRIVEIVNAERPGSAILKTVDGMDHHLAHMETPQQAYNIRVKNHGDGPYDTELSTVVTEWICSKAPCAS